MDPIPAFSAGDARKRLVGTAGAHAEHSHSWEGFAAFGANVPIPSGGPRVAVMLPSELANRDHLSFRHPLNSSVNLRY